MDLDEIKDIFFCRNPPENGQKWMQIGHSAAEKRKLEIDLDETMHVLATSCVA